MGNLATDLIIDVLNTSTIELKHLAAVLRNRDDMSRHRFLDLNNRDGGRNSLLVYEIVLRDNPFVASVGREVKAKLSDYAYCWTQLFDVIQGQDKNLAQAVKVARDAQKAAHTKLLAILMDGVESGVEAYETFAQSLCDLSDAMGEQMEAAAKRSRRGVVRTVFETSVKQASEWSGISEMTIRRYWKKPIKGLSRPPLDMKGRVEVRQRVFKDWGDQYRQIEAGKHEANMKNHAIPLSSVSRKTQRQAGFLK